LFLSFGRTFLDGVSVRLRSKFPKEPEPVSVYFRPKPLVTLRSPVTRPLKERFRLSATTETPGTFGPFAQTPALLICGSEDPTEPDCVSIKEHFPVPYLLSSLLSLIRYTKYSSYILKNLVKNSVVVNPILTIDINNC
jgi:hypothetical protein